MFPNDEPSHKWLGYYQNHGRVVRGWVGGRGKYVEAETKTISAPTGPKRFSIKTTTFKARGA
jgi:hypothetical protein